MIEFLFFFCLPMTTGYWDCSYTVYMASPDEINDIWTALGKKDKVAAFWSDDLKAIYISDLSQLESEFRHVACSNFYSSHGFNHTYCMAPHYKVQR